MKKCLVILITVFCFTHIEAQKDVKIDKYGLKWNVNLEKSKRTK